MKYKDLKNLSFGKWLNDEVISEYINFLNNSQSESKFKILNSLKCTSIFDKSDYDKIAKILQRQKIDRDMTIVLAIHKSNHWLFMTMERE